MLNPLGWPSKKERVEHIEAAAQEAALEEAAALEEEPLEEEDEEPLEEGFYNVTVERENAEAAKLAEEAEMVKTAKATVIYP